MNRTFPIETLVAIALLCPPSLAQRDDSVELGRSESGSLEAALTAKSLHVYGATPFGEVAYLGAAHQLVHERWGSLRTFSGIVAADGNGEVEFLPTSGVSEASVWVVLDVASGGALTLVPEKFQGHYLGGADVRARQDGKGLTTERQDIEFLLFRPGGGVWVGKATDGGTGDDSLRADGKLQVGLGALRSLRPGDGVLPTAIAKRDRVLAIDLDRLEAIDVSF